MRFCLVASGLKSDQNLRLKIRAFSTLPFCLSTLRGSGAGFEEPLAENLPR